MLRLDRIRFRYGLETLIDEADLRVDRKEKVALVGRNGTGKTTLLKLILGELEPDSGQVHVQKGATIGVLRQHEPVTAGGTVLSEAQGAREHVLQMQKRLEDLEAKIAAGATSDELDEYAALHEHFLAEEGYAAERDVRAVLGRMGFSADDFEKPVTALSGGERTRLALARLILEAPDLLVLDEPTNHLDLQATEWLEGWLAAYPGAVLLVSHDRVFLDRVATRYVELRQRRLASYPGPFAQFQKLRAAEDERQAEVARKQAADIDKLDEYVRRFMNSQRTAQARGRLKMKEKMESSRIEAPQRERGIHGQLAPNRRSGDLVLDVKGLKHRYGERALFHGLDWTVRRGERWGVIGENGAGKSSLVRAILGGLEPDQGSVRIGAGVEVGYFAQDGETLDPGQSPLDYMVWTVGMDPGPARNLLGRFLITGDDVFRPIRTLSGGEKNKLALARLVEERPNLLILDEPTNHLDMDSREALGEILGQYAGTLVLVSHDRWLLGLLTDHILDLRRDESIVYPGGYEAYARRKAPAPGLATRSAAPATAAPALSPRELSKAIQALERKVDEREAAVHAAEHELAELESRLAALQPDDDVLALTQRHAELKAKVELCLDAWATGAEELERLRAQQGGKSD